MEPGRQLSTYVVERATPLQYDRYGPGRRRLDLVSPDVDPPTKESGTYFAEGQRKIRTGKNGRTLKTPKIEVIPGADPHSVSFLDHHPMNENTTYIDYMKTRADMTGQGHARRLVETLYDRHSRRASETGQTQAVHWGKIMDPAAGKLHDEMAERYPHVVTMGSRHY